MGCFLCCHIFADTGSNKLENKYADFTVSPLHFLQSSFSAVQLAERRGWKMDCFCCRCIEAFLPKTFPRLAGDAGFFDPSSGCGSKLLCRNLEGELGWHLDMSPHWMLPAARAHPVIRWVQKLIHPKPRNIKHSRYYPSLGLPCVGIGSPFHLSIVSKQQFLLCIVSLCKTLDFIVCDNFICSSKFGFGFCSPKFEHPRLEYGKGILFVDSLSSFLHPQEHSK